MKVIVIGSGLVGLTTAYFLNRRGHNVTVIDRQPGPGRETSFANGALLTPSMSEPWNAPGCWRLLLRSLVSSESSLRLKPSSVPGLVGWGAAFLRNSKNEAFASNALTNLRFALYSLQALALLRNETRIEYVRASVGSLRIFRESAALEQTWAAASRQSQEGLTSRRLSPADIVEIEPALGPIVSLLVGAIHYTNDETGDAYQFCAALAAHIRQLGVEFEFSTRVDSLRLAHGQVVAALTERASFVADKYVVAAGSYSAPLLRTIGVHVPVQPAKGYSLTFTNFGGQPCLRIPIVDDQLHAVVVPLGDTLRVAGTAEFAGYNMTISKSSIRTLMKLAQQVLPNAGLDGAAARSWCGLRPMSARGIPIIGPTPVRNVLVNIGHGHLGWTMAAGSGQLLADLLDGTTPGIDPAPFRLSP